MFSSEGYKRETNCLLLLERKIKTALKASITR